MHVHTSPAMHVGLIIYGDLETISGGYLYDRKLVEYLRGQGDRVEIISLPWRNYLRHISDNFSASLLKQLTSLPIDVLVQDELNHPSLFLLNGSLAQRCAYPLVSIVHHLRSSELRPAWQNRLYVCPERRYLSSVDTFIFNSRTTKQAVEHLLHKSVPGMIAYPSGDRFSPEITAEEIKRRAWRPGPLQLLFLGNIIPRKGLHVLFEALGRLPKQVWELTVIGRTDVDPGYTRRVKSQAASSGILERVHFSGPLGDDELAAALAGHHLLVVPSSYEGYGIVYLEGMGFGLPSVGTQSGAAGEIITHDQDGILIPPGDAVYLATIIRELAQDRQRLQAMSLSARRRFERQPTWEQSMRRVRSFLKSVSSSQPT
jgi:glycosyltransferase involved in cell wall biosynthesis